MSVVANVAINLDARGANQQLRQFQQHSATAGRAAKQLQHGAAAAAWQFQQQRESTTRLAKQLRELKTEYERLTASAKASARAGGEGFGTETVDRLRALSSQIKNTREEFHSSKAAAASYRKELNAVAQKAAIDRSINKGRERLTAAQGTSEYRAAIRQLTEVSSRSNQTINSLNEQRNAWAALRNAVDPSSKAFANASQKIKDLDERLERLSLTQRDTVTRSASTSGIQSLTESLGRLALAYFSVDTAVRSIADVIRQGINYESATARLRNLADAFDESEEATRLAERTSVRFGQSITESTQQVAQLYGRLRPLGLTLAEVETVQTGFNTAARLSGSTAAESAGALLQLTQALGAGALRGEEFNSVAEQAPLVLQALGRELNVPVGQLKILAAQGKITTDVVIRALARISQEGAGQLAGAMDTSAQKVKNLQNAFERLQIALSKLALPDFLKAVQAITTELEKGADFVNDFGDAWGYVASQLAPVLGLLRQVAESPVFGAIGQGFKRGIFDATGPGRALGIVDFFRNRIPSMVSGLAERQRQSAQRSFIGPAAPQWYGPAPQDQPAQSLRERLGVVDKPDKPSKAAGAKKAAAAAKPPEDRTMELRDQLKLLIAVGEWEDRIRDLRFQGRERLALDAELSKELAQIENERVRSLQDANYEGERAHINAIAQAKQVAARRQSEDAIRELLSQRFQQELQNTQAVRDAAKPIEDLRKAQEQQLNDAKQYMRLVSEGMLPAEAQRIMNFEQTVKQQQESLDLQIAITEAAITEAEAKSLGSVELRKELTLLQRKRKAVDAAAAQGPGPGQTNAGRIEDALAAAQGELNELTAISNMAITSANAIGNAFGQAFKSIASGSASTKEVLADFFQSVSNAFLDMAAQIIAKQITMLILQTALKALGATGGVGAPGGEAFGVSPEGGGLWGGMSLGEMPALGTFAKGGVFTPDGPLHAFAKGGVVTAPTEFAFADGGTMRRGLMAEAEAEAIMPLKRTADGRLGVEATIPFQRSADDTTEPTIPFQRSADGSPSRSNPFAALSAASIPFTKSTERLMVERSDRETIAAINNPKPLEVRFESQVINGVEYVTAEQHRKGMAEAADRGRKLTLAELRNSVKTRKMMGLS